MDDWVLLGILMGAGWVLAAIAIIKNQILKYQIKTMDPTEMGKRLELKETYIKDLEREIDGYRDELTQVQEESKSWQGKYHQKGQIKKLPGDKYDLSKTSDIGIVAEDVLNQVEDSLPPDIQKIIKEPKIRSMILDYANEHPDEAAEYIKRFLSPKSTSSKSGPIPDFDLNRAI